MSKYFDGSGRNPPEFLNKNGNTNVPMNPNEGIRFKYTSRIIRPEILISRLEIFTNIHWTRKVEAVTCSIKTDPEIDFCEARQKLTLATIVDEDGFPRYNYEEGRPDTKDSLQDFKSYTKVTVSDVDDILTREHIWHQHHLLVTDSCRHYRLSQFKGKWRK